jgi:hypothetical protein
MAAGLNRTTIAAPLSAADTLVNFASGSGLQKGHVAYIDREAMVLQTQPIPAVPSIWQVMRGQCGTGAAAHAVNDQVFTGPPGHFFLTSPQGASSQDGEIVLPRINVLTGDAYMVSGNGAWQTSVEAVPEQLSLAPGTLQTFTSNGALIVQNGSVEVNSASARALTLPVATTGDEGTVMTIFGSGGGAHTVTPSGGFAGTATVGTFGAGGGTLILQVLNGKFRPLSAVGVTFT